MSQDQTAIHFASGEGALLFWFLAPGSRCWRKGETSNGGRGFLFLLLTHYRLKFVSNTFALRQVTETLHGSVTGAPPTPGGWNGETRLQHPNIHKPSFLVGVSEVTWLRSNRESTGRNSLAGMASGMGQAGGRLWKLNLLEEHIIL